MLSPSCYVSAVLLLVWLRASLTVVTPLLSRWSSSPALVRTLLLMLLLLPSPSVRDHGLDIWSIFKVLVKPTHGACNFLVLVCRKRKYRNEAKSKPGPSSDAMSTPISAVTTLSCDVLGAFELACEFCKGQRKHWGPMCDRRHRRSRSRCAVTYLEYQTLYRKPCLRFAMWGVHSEKSEKMKPGVDEGRDCAQYIG